MSQCSYLVMCYLAIMRCIVVTTARLVERHKAFKIENPQLEYSLYFGPDRSELKPDSRIKKVLEEEKWTLSAIASALSHIQIWEQVSQQDEPVVVLEDDAKCILDFYQSVDELLQTLPYGWDLALLGLNFNAFAYVKFLRAPFGIAKITLNENLLRENFHLIDQLSYLPKYLPLQAAWGVCGYLLSPKGARKLLERIPILESKIIAPQGVDWVLEAKTIDGLMNGCYGDLQTFLSVPPIVFVRNDHKGSTMDIKQ